jgi:hypothetical protein
MRFSREGRRTLAQFLNNLGVGMLATLVLTPIAAGTLRPDMAMGSMLGAAICHGLALHFGPR